MGRGSICIKKVLKITLLNINVAKRFKELRKKIRFYYLTREFAKCLLPNFNYENFKKFLLSSHQWEQQALQPSQYHRQVELVDRSMQL
jgi:hypothetical protein